MTADLSPRDPLLWAKHPKSEVAVRMLVDAAPRDHRLMEILLHHLTFRERLTRDEGGAVRQALQRVIQSPPSWLAAALQHREAA